MSAQVFKINVNTFQGSNDSGKGASLSESATVVSSSAKDFTTYEFDWPTDLCGRLIGKQHKNINSIMAKSNTRIVVRRKQYDPEHQTCVIEGELYIIVLYCSIYSE